MKSTDINLKEIETQLSCPNGASGIKIGENMNESNIGMTLASINILNITEKDSLLEIGHGNCGHLNELFKITNDISYTGLEISETMKKEAQKINKKIIANTRTEFHLYDGITIPFPKNSFSKIFTVNTLYFWNNPTSFLAEIYHVLKPSGIFVLTFAQKEFMENLPFVKDKFKLYDIEEVKKLIKTSAFSITSITTRTERIKSKAGNWVNRIFYLIKVTKNSFPNEEL
ncbi:class I SAM-dependent methyltransferase [Tenacibaculum maritimum]|uniref:class I SAM-dependent methyltransferase n=1 Tax=Tenacibaculum maritimum TaxID=107401 RepID=UPI001E5BADB9|nr:class I SAM-dependent methyltransferase [Tenacibaculum maritimum]MCD9583554.1 class I SAM-dependent methyltransferase [Tenacibaculum maritimum]MCD9620472.1 class I SAM-dependent methyltransferase [Tenacibaculum maritimum]MCD9626736.1 class I SAM-dependent methyltransferase [Tenacibaculum maritimum]MCD9629360.1 class I SAM-dependent methyltransferase [Tenacibaculum maritimum]MCD9632325.1 class I SAM-dependent methyltransferase [Tenacibaculum maritimum]